MPGLLLVLGLLPILVPGPGTAPPAPLAVPLTLAIAVPFSVAPKRASEQRIIRKQKQFLRIGGKQTLHNVERLWREINTDI